MFERELNSGADIVVGIREHKQRWAEIVFSAVSIAVWHIQDPLCGMKGYRLELLKKASTFDTYGSIGTEFLIRAFRSGCAIHELCIDTAARLGNSRFGSGIIVNIRILRSLFMGLVLARPF